MKWVPKWLGRCYSQILLHYGENDFDLDSCRVSLNYDEKMLNTMLSRLCAAGWIERVGRGRYRALHPYVVMLLILNSGWLERVKQKEYLPLLTRAVGRIFEFYGSRLVSLVLFGSIARGEAKANSDLDLLLVAKNLPQEYSERVMELVEVLKGLSSIRLKLWHEHRIYANLDVIPLTPEEAKVNQPFYLDMLLDSIAIVDNGNFVGERLQALRKKLEQLGARRISTPKGEWFWELKPSAKIGKVIEI